MHARRIAVTLLTLLSLAIPLAASAQQPATQGFGSQITFRPLWMRNTSAASNIARQANWAFGGETGQPTAGAFADSTVFRRGAGTRTAYDTTVAIARANIAFPPFFGPGFSATARADTLAPWFVLRIEQDTLSYSFSGTSGGNSTADSIRVAVEYSYDGISWFSMPGTPTYRFDTVFLTSGGDGLQSPTIFGVEDVPGGDCVQIPFKCDMGVAAVWGGGNYIMNLTGCTAGTYMRFIFGSATIGQWKASIGTWQTNRIMD